MTRLKMIQLCQSISKYIGSDFENSMNIFVVLQKIT